MRKRKSKAHENRIVPRKVSTGEVMLAIRKSWVINPVTRVVPSKKVYSRARLKEENRQHYQKEGNV